jgi:hypothetical protein
MPAPAFRPGLLDALGRFMEQGFTNLNTGLKDAQGRITDFQGKASEVAKGAADAARDAAGAVAALPVQRLVSGREQCAPAPNGAPDCQSAATAICKANGFKTGRSADAVSAQKCPAQVWLERRQAREGECTIEHFVTRAMCQ